MLPQFETDRLIIRPIALSDKHFMLKLLNTPGWLQYIGDKKIYDEIEAEKYIQKIMDNPHFFYYVCELKESLLAIGILSFLYRDNQEFPDMGFAMLPEFQNKGYAWEATKNFLGKIVSEKSISTIIAIALPDNLKSIKLLEKLGFSYDHEFIDQSDVLHAYSFSL